MLGKVSFLIYNVIGGELMLLALSVHYARDVLDNAVHGAANDLTGRNMLGAVGKGELMLCLKSRNSKLSVLRGKTRLGGAERTIMRARSSVAKGLDSSQQAAPGFEAASTTACKREAEDSANDKLVAVAA